MMLSSLIKQHANDQVAKRELIDKKRKDAILASNDLTRALVEHLNLGAAEAYLNQKQIDEEGKLLHQNMLNFSKQAQQWSSAIEGFMGTLKEIGDLENWSSIIENDMKIISDTLEQVYMSNYLKINQNIFTLFENLNKLSGLL